MISKIDDETLLIIPCCKTKIEGGDSLFYDPLAKLLSKNRYDDLLLYRETLKEWLLDVDQYMSAIDKFNGKLYRSHRDLKEYIKNKTNGVSQPKLIILSAQYGILHPESPINKYSSTMPVSKSGLWFKEFPQLLKNYVERQGIKRIRFYTGKSTGYYQVIYNAVKKLMSENIIDEVIYYNVINASSYHTPHNHGLQLMKDLSGESNIEFTRTVEAVYLPKLKNTNTKFIS